MALAVVVSRIAMAMARMRMNGVMVVRCGHEIPA
jgi:hypothetical protein